MVLFTDGDGIPLAFSLFPGNQNEQKSLKPLETKILQQFGCDKFIYCSDAGLASEDNRVLNHMGQRAFIVTQSIKKLPAEDRAWALNKNHTSHTKSCLHRAGGRWKDFQLRNPHGTENPNQRNRVWRSAVWQLKKCPMKDFFFFHGAAFYFQTTWCLAI